MFNRDEKTKRYTDHADIVGDLLRFESDEYATKYLSNTYNPEFKIRCSRILDAPDISTTGRLFAWGTRTSKTAEEVF